MRIPTVYYSFNKQDWIELPLATPLNLSSLVYLKVNGQYWGPDDPTLDPELVNTVTLNISQPYYVSGKISYLFNDPALAGGTLGCLFDGAGHYGIHT